MKFGFSREWPENQIACVLKSGYPQIIHFVFCLSQSIGGLSSTAAVYMSPICTHAEMILPKVAVESTSRSTNFRENFAVQAKSRNTNFPENLPF